MFLTLLGGSLLLGAGLLTAASYSEGALVAIHTTARVIGWLFLVAGFAGLAGARRGSLARLSAAAVALCAGLVLLLMGSVGEGDAPSSPIQLAAADVLPAREAPVAMPASMEVVMPVMRKEAPSPRPVEEKSLVRAAADACAAFDGIERLQCSRCGEKFGLAWIACQEQARLEYCEGRQGDAAICPSTIPSASLDSPPG